MSRIYLDYNATTPLGDAAASAMSRWLKAGVTANASSVHTEGRQARDAVSTAREQVATALSARPKDLVFTSGATESNQTVLAGVHGRILISSIEHPSIAVSRGERDDVECIAVDREARIDLDDLRRRLPGAALCSVMYANNEVGTIQPIRRIADECREQGVLLHVDASQALGRIPIDVNELGADLVTISAHKAYGPPGVGALWIRPRLEWPSLFGGGHQERGRRGGTENVLGIVGFGAAASEVSELLAHVGRIEALRDRLAEGLASMWSLQRFSPTAGCLPNTLNVGFPPCDGETILMALDLSGVSVSTGSACSAGSLDPSPVLLAMGYPVEIAQTAIRFSLGVGTTDKEIDETLDIVKRVVPEAAKELEWA